MQRNDSRGKDEELSGHSLSYFHFLLDFLLKFILGKCLQAFAPGF
jgi:hypothetical protein